VGEDFGGCGVVPPAATVGFFDQIGSEEDEINSQASRLLILACLRRF